MKPTKSKAPAIPVAKLLKPETYRSQPWKNGKGKTREIAVDSEDPFRWRLSWAPLAESGPFSAYPGYDRILVLLKGGPITLSHDGKKPREITPLRAYPFKGDALTEAIVSAEGEDFNVFTRQKQARAGVYPTYLSQDEDLQFPLAGREHFIFCVEGSLEVVEANSKNTFVLSAGDTFRLSRLTDDEFLNLRAKGRSANAVCLWVVIHHEI